MASTTPTNYAPQIPTEIIDSLVLDFVRPASFMPLLARVKDITGIPGLKVDFNEFGDITVAASTPGTDDTMAAHTIAEDGTITAAEVTGPISVDLLTMEASGITAEAIARQIGLAFAAKLDSDLCTVFQSSTDAGSSAGTTLSIATMEAARLYLLQQSAPTGPTNDNGLPANLCGIKFVGSEKACSDLITASRTAGIAIADHQLMRLYPDAAGANARFWYAGITGFGTEKVTTVSSNSVNAMFVPAALGLVTKGRYETLQAQWVPGRSVRMNGRLVYGVGIIKSTWMRKVRCASS